MSDWGLARNERREGFGANVEHAAANTKSAWVQMIAATSFTYDAIDLFFTNLTYSGGTTAYLVDVAHASFIVQNVFVDCARAVYSGGVHIRLPIRVAKGSALYVRCQSPLGAGTRGVYCFGYGIAGGWNSDKALGGNSVTYGSNTANSQATLIDPGATNNAWGAWTELTSSTSRVHNFLGCIAGAHSTSDPGNGGVVIQIAKGAAASETVIAEWRSDREYNSSVMKMNVLEIYQHLPAGTRLSARSQVTDVSLGGRNVSLMALGV